jgi:tRNA pseudouridine55 synthase
VLRTKKIGHAGTLDPMANGLLIVCTGRGTKWVDFYQAQVKGYTGCLRLGESTPSYDAETEVRRCRRCFRFLNTSDSMLSAQVCERSAWEHVTDSALEHAASAFLGSIMQVPPMYSAIKQNGVPLYVKARAGVEVERKSREVTIARFDVERAVAGGPDVRFAVVRCSRAGPTCSRGWR